MTLTRPVLNPEPEQRLLSWGVCYEGQPGKGQRCVDIAVWVPTELAQWEHAHCWDTGKCRLTRLADYLWDELGFEVCLSIGWGSSDEGDGLTCVSVPVRARDVKAARAFSVSRATIYRLAEGEL
jgi:hypothetical protein